MKKNHKNKISLEQQLIQQGTHSGKMLCDRAIYEAWHIPIGEYVIDWQKTMITDMYTGAAIPATSVPRTTDILCRILFNYST